MFTPKGKFGWYELMTSDTKAAGKFYSDVVGWTTQEMPGDGPAYTVFNLGNVGIAGMLTIPGHVAWVFIPAGDKQFKRVEVQAGKILPGNKQELLSGINPGQQGSPTSYNWKPPWRRND